MTVRRLIGGAIYALSAAIGILAFIYPFFVPVASQVAGVYAHSQDAPLLTATLVGLSVVALLVELQGQAINAKTVAMLGVLVALTSVLRFLEVAFPMPGGFSPIFAPIIISGYVFGGRFGYLMGTFTLLASALITGGVGPWLPYQMFTAGWAGLTAGWLTRIPGLRAHRPSHQSLELGAWDLAFLSVFGFLWGLLYGVVVNVYFWPFAAGPTNQSWAPGIGLRETLGRYAIFYAVTSLMWDLFRAVGNVLLILLLGAPMVKTLARFRQRFNFEVRSYA
jgi:energy-coupling factor transport system substrate-specific component